MPHLLVFCQMGITHVPCSMAFPCVALAFSCDGLLPVLYLTNPDLVFKSQCTHYFLQEVFTSSPRLGEFPAHVLP